MDLAELTRVLMCVCLDVYEWLAASAYCISSPTVLRSPSAAAELLDGLAAPSVPSVVQRPVLQPSQSNSRPVFLFFLLGGWEGWLQHTPASLYVHSSFRVSCYEAVGSPLCPAKAAPLLFVKPPFFSFFYPCANRRGRVPELDPIFHARLPFVWRTPPLIRIPVVGPL